MKNRKSPRRGSLLVSGAAPRSARVLHQGLLFALFSCMMALCAVPGWAQTYSINNAPPVVEGGNSVFTVTRAGDPDLATETRTVNFSVSPLSATTPEDYQVPATSSVTFLPNETTAQITVVTENDSISEPDQLFNVSLTSASAGTIPATGATGNGTITDNDPNPTLSVAPVSLSEGNGGTTTFIFTLQLSAASQKTITAKYKTGGGSATAGTDYTAVADFTEITFTPGQTQRPVPISVTGDAVYESNETFEFQVGEGVNVTIPGGLLIVNGTIQNDDNLDYTISTPSPVTEGGKILFVVTRIGDDVSQPRTIHYFTTNGSATAPNDYTGLQGQILTIAATQTSATIEVQTQDDAIAEDQEDFTVTIRNPSASNPLWITDVTQKTAVGTINDNDGTPTLSVTPATFPEGDSGNKNFPFVFTLSKASSSPITIDVSTEDETALVSDSDYNALPGGTTVVFPAGVTSKTQNVTVRGDIYGEKDETFILSAKPNNNSLNLVVVPDGEIRVKGTITNDDVPDVVNFFDVLDDDRTGTHGNLYADSTVLQIEGTKLLNAAGGKPIVRVGGVAVADADITIVGTEGKVLRISVPKGTPVGSHLVEVETDGGKDSQGSFIIPPVVPASVSVSAVPTRLVEGEFYPTSPFLPEVRLTVTLSYATQADIILPPITDVPVSVNVAAALGASVGAKATSFGPAEPTDPIIEGGANPPGTVQLITFPANGGQVGSVSNTSITLTYTGNDTAQGNNSLLFSATTSTGIDVNYAGKTTGEKGDSIDRLDPHRIEVFDPVLDGADPSNPTGRPKTLESDEKTGRVTTFEVGLYDTSNTLNGGDPNGIRAGLPGSNLPLDTVPSSPVFVTLRVNGSPDNTDGGDEAYLSTDTQEIPAREQVLVFSATVDPTSPLYYTKKQTVYVHGLDDPDFDFDQEYQIEIVSVDSRDPEYVQLGKAPAQLTGIGQRTIMVNIDDEQTDVAELPGVIVQPQTSSTNRLSTNEGGSTANFTMRLSSKPTDDVQIFLRTDRPDEGKIINPATNLPVDNLTLTFTPTNYDQDQQVTVTGTDDTLEDGNQNYRIVTTLESNDTNYGGPNNPTQTTDDGIDPVDVFLVNNDNEAPGATVTPTLLAIVEGDNDTFEVVLNKRPTADVFINITSSKPGVAAANKSRVQFTPTTDEAITTDSAGNTKGGWNKPQTVQVNTTSDPSSNADDQVTINLAAAISGDANYNGINVPDVNVFVLNDPRPGFTIVPTTGLTTSETGNGNPQTFTVRLNTQPAADVTLPLTTSDPAEGRMINPQTSGLTNSRTLTFTPTDWSTPQTVTVRGVDDQLADGNKQYSITTGDPASTPGSAYDDLTAADVVDVTLINQDNEIPNVIVNPTDDLITNETGLKAVFNVSLATKPSADVTINLSTSNPNEGKLIDTQTNLAVNTLALTFTPTNWQIAQTVSVEGQDDAIVDGDMAYSIITEATSADNAYEGIDAPDVNLINKDNEKLELSISPSPVSVTEGDSGQTDQVFNVNLSIATANTITVQVDAVDGTAKSGSGDYAVLSKTVTFAAGETQKTVTLTVLGDETDEADEALTVALSNPTGSASIHDTEGVANVTITDDDDPPALAIADVSANESTGTATFTVTLQDANGDPIVSGRSVSVKYATSDGTATASEDYTATNGTLTIAAGSSSGTFTVPLFADGVDEPDETFTVTLSNAVNASLAGAGADATATGTIIDDEGPQIFIGNVSKAEGTGGNTTFTFQVVLSAISSQNVTVNYSTANGSAVAIDDYTPKTGSLTIPAGDTEATIDVIVKGDAEEEPTETFAVTLSNPVKATLGNSQGTGTITNDDNGPGLSVDDITVTEGTGGSKNAVFTVTLTPASLQVVTVKYATGDGTAHEDADYTKKSGTLTFAAGETTKSVTVPITTDAEKEDDEAFTLTLSASTNSDIVDDEATATIVDDDGVGRFSIDLDANDSSGATGNDYRNDTWNQSNPTAIADSDAAVIEIDENGDAISTGAKISKVRVQILNRMDGSAEVLTATIPGGTPITKVYSNGILTLTGPATPAQFEAVVRSVQYQNTAQAITGDTRSFRFDVYGGASVASAYATIGTNLDPNVPVVPAVIDLNGPDALGVYNIGVDFNRNWVKGGITKLADTDAFADKLDNSAIAKIEVSFYDDPADGIATGRQDGTAEVLSATTAGVVTSQYNSTTGVLTLQGPGYEADFSAALRSIEYTNSNDTPTGNRRKFLFKVFANGANGGESAAAITSITINPAPTDDWNGDGVPDSVDENPTDDPDGDPTGGDIDGDGIPDAFDSDMDGDGIPNNVDTDANGNGIPDVQEQTDTLIDLNGSSAGVNWINKWVKTATTRLADTDAVIRSKDGKIASMLVVITDRQDGDAETLQFSTTGTPDITGEFDETTGILTLTSKLVNNEPTATPAQFQQVLRTITYSNEGQEVEQNNGEGGEGGNNDNNEKVLKITGNKRTIEFIIESGTGGSASASTTIYVSPPPSNEDGTIFVAEKTFDIDKATIVLHILNETDQPYNNIVVQGLMGNDNNVNLDGATFTPSHGTLSTKVLNPTSLKTLLENPQSSKQVNWYIQTIPAHSEVTLTIELPLKRNAYGKKVTGGWTARFGGTTPEDQQIAPIVLE